MVQGQAASTPGGASATVARLLADDGTAAHPYAIRLIAPRAATRDLGDAVHALCTVHGHHPDLLTIAAGAAQTLAPREWLTLAGIGFAADRAALAQLAAAAGPLPSTPGNAIAATALATERQTLERLARSERVGVAAGAAAALVGDWHTIRIVLAAAADRFGVSLSLPVLPDPVTLLATAPERAARASVRSSCSPSIAACGACWRHVAARAAAECRH